MEICLSNIKMNSEIYSIKIERSLKKIHFTLKTQIHWKQRAGRWYSMNMETKKWKGIYACIWQIISMQKIWRRRQSHHTVIKQTLHKEVITINVYAPIYIKQTIYLQGERVKTEFAAMMALWFKSEVSPTGSISDHFLLMCSITDATVWRWERYPGESLGTRLPR